MSKVDNLQNQLETGIRFYIGEVGRGWRGSQWTLYHSLLEAEEAAKKISVLNGHVIAVWNANVEDSLPLVLIFNRAVYYCQVRDE